MRRDVHRVQLVEQLLGEQVLAGKVLEPAVTGRDDAHVGRAEAVLREARRPLPLAPLWRCEHCAEDNEQQFAVCWNCGNAAPTVQE